MSNLVNKVEINRLVNEIMTTTLGVVRGLT